MSKWDVLTAELAFLFEPLAAAAESNESASLLFRQFGYDLQDAALTGVLDDLRAASSVVAHTLDSVAGSAQPAAEIMMDVARAVFRSVKDFGDGRNVRAAVHNAHGLSVELLDYLFASYLSRRFGPATAVLKALGVIGARHVNPDDPIHGRDIGFERLELHWHRLGDFISDNDSWARDVYAWGGDPSAPGRVFEHEKAIDALVAVFDAMQLSLAQKRKISGPRLADFLANAGDVEAFEAALPLIQNVFDHLEDDGNPVFTREAGLKVVPYGDLEDQRSLGLALAPYATADAQLEEKVTPRLWVGVTLNGDAAGGTYMTVTPAGIGTNTPVAVQGSFELGLRFAADDGAPVIQLGNPASTFLEVRGIVAAMGGNLAGDVFVASGVEGLAVSIDLSQDGFLGTLVGGPIRVDAGDVLVGWRPGRGVYFEGGTSVGVTVPQDLHFGAINIGEIGLHVAWDEDVRVTFLASGDARLGPLYAAVENVGLVARVVPSDNGSLGRYDLAFGFQPPTGYAISFEAPVLQGGGFLAAMEDEYRGALALKFESFGLAAFGILATRLADGKDGFSFVASIFGEFNVPLGFGFFLTGVGGVIGLNRTVDTDALRKTLVEGRMDNLLFPSDPIASAGTILEDMANIYPTREDHHLFGPVARVAWGQPVLVQGKLGVVVEVGDSIRILVLGGLQAALPTEDAGLIVLNLSFFGDIDFGARTLSFDAALQGSRVATWPVSGDAAIRSGWAPRMNHLASFGGLHPRYPRPPNLPDLRRLSIAFGTSNPRVTLSAYAAVTLNSVQFGARADLYAKGPKIRFVGRCAAQGWAYFDALIFFNPFGFDVALGGGLELLVDGDVVAGLGFRLRLTGPNTFKIHGKVWVKVFGIKVDFRISHRWGSSQSLPIETVNPVRVLRQAIAQAPGFEAVAATGRFAAVAFAATDAASAAIDAAGGARFVQRAVPLNVKLEKLGEARLAGGVDRLELRVYEPGGHRVNVRPARLEFAVAQFKELSDAERLRAPAFEQHTAGFEVASDVLVVAAALALESDYTYEVIEIGTDDSQDRFHPAVPHVELKQAFAARWARVQRGLVAQPPEGFPGTFAAPEPVVIRDMTFVTPAMLPPYAMGTVLSDAAGRLANLMGTHDAVAASFTSMQDLRERTIRKEHVVEVINPVVADYAAFGGTRSL